MSRCFNDLCLRRSACWLLVLSRFELLREVKAIR